ncbi:MAG: hypothetical protein V2J10_02915 [Wenzhouxiangella sp.]|jgi:Tol biopolymer transport system component|nr:hypothetical protein [Wenzhouxiangella sp.]
MSLPGSVCFSIVLTIALAIVLPGLISTAHASPQIAQLVSKPPDPDFFDGFGNGFSTNCALSADGQRLAFESSASNLVEGDSNGITDIFVSDRASETLNLISRTASGELANGSSGSPAISGNGRFVLFRSTADNLGASGLWQGFRHDLDTGVNTAVGFAPDGTAFDTVFTVSLSFDGSLATFEADDQAWLRDIDQGTTTLISSGVDAQPANASVSDAHLSSDGSTVVFDSGASNLVADDTNDDIDVFIRDLVQGTTVRIAGQGGVEPDGNSLSPRVSADGRWIVFFSAATNLVPFDTNGVSDVFLHDRDTGTTIRLSEDGNGVGGNAGSTNVEISADGRFVVFESQADNLVPGLVGQQRRLFLYDHDFATLVQIAETTEEPFELCVYSNGNRGGVAYRTSEHPLIPPNLQHEQIVLEAFQSFDPDRLRRINRAPVMPGTQGSEEAWVISRSIPPVPVEIGTGGSWAPDLAGSGRFLVFQTRAGNLTGRSPEGTQIVRLDQLSGNVEVVSLGTDGEPVEAFSGAFDASMDAAGNRVVFKTRSGELIDDDNNDRDDIYIRDLNLAQTLRLSVGINDQEANARSDQPAISADGGTVAFESDASNLVENDNNGQRDIFAVDLASRLLERISVSNDDQEANARSESPDINASGRFIVFSSTADLLAAGNPGTNEQIWLRDRQAGTTELISATPGNQPGNGDSDSPRISANGRWIAFRSEASDLDPDFPAPPSPSIYLHDRQTGNSRLVSLDASGQPVPVIEEGSFDGPVLAGDGSAVLFQRFSALDRTSAGLETQGEDPEGTIYLYSRLEGQTTRIEPRTIDGMPPDSESSIAAVEPGGRVIYIVSEASNLVPGMVNTYDDIYRIDLDFDRLFNDRFQASPR